MARVNVVRTSAVENWSTAVRTCAEKSRLSALQLRVVHDGSNNDKFSEKYNLNFRLNITAELAKNAVFKIILDFLSFLRLSRTNLKESGA